MAPFFTAFCTGGHYAFFNAGYDVLHEAHVIMVAQGIIDPVKVTRSAVENAASIGAMILTTEALITDIPEKERAPVPPMPDYERGDT